MVIDRLRRRLALVVALTLVALGVSACYKDAGENVQPTSNRVDLRDILSPTPLPTQPETATPTAELLPSPTRKLVPTTTPSDQGQAAPTAIPTQEPPAAEPSATPRLQPSFTPVAATSTPTGPAIATPGMSDILPSATTAPTLDPAFRPTPTGIPVDENPCIHVVRSGDTLYSLAREYEVEMMDLVAANPAIFGGNPNTVLQIGWELRLPGCLVEGEQPTPTPAEAAPEGAPGGTPATGPITHVVQPGEGIYAIARQYGVTPQAIIEANNLANPNLIYPGDTLIIPVGQ